MGRADQDGRGEGGPGRPAPRFHRRGRQQGRGRAGIGIQFQIQIQISSLRCRGSQEDHPGRGVRGGQAGGGDGAHGTQRLGQDHPPRRPVGPVLVRLRNGPARRGGGDGPRHEEAQEARSLRQAGRSVLRSPHRAGSAHLHCPPAPPGPGRGRSKRSNPSSASSGWVAAPTLPSTW